MGSVCARGGGGVEVLWQTRSGDHRGDAGDADAIGGGRRAEAKPV